jgi:hypothetical protein
LLGPAYGRRPRQKALSWTSISTNGRIPPNTASVTTAFTPVLVLITRVTRSVSSTRQNYLVLLTSRSVGVTAAITVKIVILRDVFHFNII